MLHVPEAHAGHSLCAPVCSPGGAVRTPYAYHRWEASQRTRDASKLTESGKNLVLSFGVNDCESRLGKIDLEQMWSMLVPLPCTTPPCVACVEI